MSDAMLRILGFDRINDFTKIDDFEHHLSRLFESGAYVYFDRAQPILLFGRQLVERLGGLKIEIYAREHAPPHFHVKGGDVDAVFAIADCSLLRGTIGRREEDLVRFWFNKSKGRLVEVWNSTRPAGCPVRQINAL